MRSEARSLEVRATNQKPDVWDLWFGTTSLLGWHRNGQTSVLMSTTWTMKKERTPIFSTTLTHRGKLPCSVTGKESGKMSHETLLLDGEGFSMLPSLLAIGSGKLGSLIL